MVERRLEQAAEDARSRPAQAGIQETEVRVVNGKPTLADGALGGHPFSGRRDTSQGRGYSAGIIEIAA